MSGSSDDRIEVVLRPYRGLLAERGRAAVMKCANRGARTPYSVWLASEIMRRLDGEATAVRHSPARSMR